MKNLRKIAMALAVGVLAIGFSAFTSASTKNAKFNPVYYALNHAGTTYTRSATDPTSKCTEDDQIDNCALSYTSDKGPSFPETSIPSGATVLSGPGWVNP